MTQWPEWIDDHLLSLFQNNQIYALYSAWSPLLPKQVCLIFRGGSYSCQLWSMCDKRHARLLGPVSPLHWLPMTKCTPAHTYTRTHTHIHTHACTHTWYKHTCPCCQSRWEETGCRPGGPTEWIINLNTYNPSMKEAKEGFGACAYAIYAYFHLQFTFTRGCNLHLNFGVDIWEILKVPQLQPNSCS